MSIEMSRILRLPTKKEVTDKKIQKLSEELIQPEPFEGRCKCGNVITCGNPAMGVPLKPLRLLPDQVAGVLAVRNHMSMFGDIKVGGGKTALAYLIASEVFKRRPNSRVLYLLPPNLVKALRVRHEPWARRHLKGWIPKWVHYHGKPARLRLTYAKSPGPGIHVVPYSLLSEKDAPLLLERISADFVIADEAHTISGEARSGRNSAFWDWCRDRDPDGAVMSGTMSKTRIRDCYRLARWVLGEDAPVPRTFLDMETWDEVMHSGSEENGPICRTKLKIFKPLVRWAAKQFPDRMTDLSERARTVRLAYQLRFNSCPGVVSSAGQAPLGVGLEINNWPIRSHGQELANLLNDLDVNWLTPDGELLTYAVEKQEVFRQLTCGFYLHHFWDESKPRVEEAMEAWDARLEYRAELRNFLKSTRAKHMKLYLPSAVGKYHEVHGKIKGWRDLYDLWREWKRLQVEGLPDRSVEFRRVDDYKVRSVVEWAKTNKKRGGIVWVNHHGFAQWVYEAMREAGLKPIAKASGDSWLQGDGSDGRLVIASIGAFFQGQNLQHYDAQVIAQWCRTSTRMEQLLGRCHREGQQSATVQTHTLLHTEFDHMQVYATLLDTIYVKQIQGGEPKLLVAEWGEEPRSYPADFLQERGFGLAQSGGSGDDEQGDD